MSDKNNLDHFCNLQGVDGFQQILMAVFTFKIRRYLFCISTTECMLAHAFAWSKMIKNIQK